MLIQRRDYILPGLACLLLALLSTPATAGDEPASPGRWKFGAYFDLGYGASDNRPENELWRSKGTTFDIDSPQVNMAMAYVRKETTDDSRWGFDFGVQTGVDTEGLIPISPPAAGSAVSDADTLRHLYRANFSYRIRSGKNGVEVTAGLINSFIGYESYHAIDNPNYTRGYLLDFVPYFMVGVGAAYPAGDALSLSSYVITGWDYLAQWNDVPGFGQQVVWKPSSQITVTQNLYYGPDQRDTSVEFWRFFSDSIFEWKNDRFLVAAAFDFGTQKQADLAGNPRSEWNSSAVWFRWRFANSFSLAVRPEVYRDPNGFMTLADQTIRALTTTLRFDTSIGARHRLAALVEYRHDRSTGPDGGFYEGPDNGLVPDQQLILAAFLWSFDL